MRREHSHSEHVRKYTDVLGDSRAPRAFVCGPDGSSRWVARCPRCAERDEETVVAGDGEEARALCHKCGATIEVRPSGAYRAAPRVVPLG